MSWGYTFTTSAKKDVKRLSVDNRRRIFAGLDKFTENFPEGDVQKLGGRDEEYRLRIGGYRVTFRRDDSNQSLVILEVEKRGDIY